MTPSSKEVIVMVCLAGCQLPRQSCSTTSLPELDKGGKNTGKGSWVKIMTGRDDSPFTFTGKTDLIWRNQFNLMPIKPAYGNEKKTPKS